MFIEHALCAGQSVNAYEDFVFNPHHQLHEVEPIVIYIFMQRK